MITHTEALLGLITPTLSGCLDVNGDGLGTRLSPSPPVKTIALLQKSLTGNQQQRSALRGDWYPI